MRGVAAGILIRAISQIIRLGSLMLLARLLAPGDFGLVAMTMAVVGILAVLQDLGLSGATLRFPRITHVQISGVFWFNVAAAGAVALLVAAVSPLLSRFYSDPRIVVPAIVLAVGFALGGVAAQHLMLLKRSLRFTEVAKVSLWSGVASAGTSVLGAYMLGNYWALIAGMVAGNVVTLGLAWTYCDWRPSRPGHLREALRLVKFGGHVVLYGLLGYVAKNIHTLVIGRSWGAAEAGLFSRAVAARNMCTLSLMEPLAAVVPAGLGALRSQADTFSRYYYKIATLTVMAAMPMTFLCVVLAHEAVHLLLGPQWQRSAALLQLLALGIVPQMVSQTTGWIFYSVGDSRRLMLWGVLAWGGMIAAVLVGARFGVDGIALALTAFNWLLLLPGLAYAFKGTPLELLATLRSAAPAFLGGLLGAGAGAAALVGGGGWPILIRLLVGSGVFGITYLLVLIAIPSQRRLLRDVITEFGASRWQGLAR